MNDRQRALNEEGRETWDEKAAFWDDVHGDEGNLFHRRLVGPAVERLLALEPGEQVLDIACGSGVMARRLATLGAHVTAVDFSPALLKRARERTRRMNLSVDYKIADATDEAALVALGAGRYDAVISTMALMDIPIITPLYRAARRLLRPGGRFVFATAHPAFNSNKPTFLGEMEDRAGELVTTHALKIHNYIEPAVHKAVGAPNEPAPHNYYHRPLHQLLGEAFAAGFVLDALEEPVFTAEDAAIAPTLSWRSLWRMPPVLAGRLS